MIAVAAINFPIAYSPLFLSQEYSTKVRDDNDQNLEVVSSTHDTKRI